MQHDELVGGRIRIEGPGFALHSYGPGRHIDSFDKDTHVLDVYLGGAVSDYLATNGKVYSEQCPPNSFVFLPASEKREIRATRTGDTVRVAFTAQTLSIWPERQRLIENAKPLIHVFDTGMIGTAWAMRDQLVHFRETTSHADGLSYASILIARLCYHLIENEAETLRVRPEPIQRAIEYIEANLEEPLPLADVASLAGISPYHFAKVFRELMGESLHQYILRRRVEMAQSLLSETGDSIAEIAYQAGFGSQSHMTTVFKRILGRTPAQFRLKRN